MVVLRAMVLTTGAGVSQCAEATSMAWGRPMSRPRPRRKSRAGASTKGRVGAPWLRKTAGNIGQDPGSGMDANRQRSDHFVIPQAVYPTGTSLVAVSVGQDLVWSALPGRVQPSQVYTSRKRSAAVWLIPSWPGLCGIGV